MSLFQYSAHSKKNNWGEHLIDLVRIVFRCPGRIRFKLDFVGDEILSDTLRRELHKTHSLKLESYSARTRSVLVSYDAAQKTEFDVAVALFKGIKEFARVHGGCDPHHHHHANSRAKITANDGECAHDHSALVTDAGIRKEFFKLTATGAVLAFLVYRKITRRSLLFAANPLGIVASIITISSGYPIFRSGLLAVSKQKKASDDTLISIAVLASVVMGESLTGLSVVWLINLGRLLETITLKRSRTAIKELMDSAPKTAWHVNEHTGIKNVSVEHVQRGQVVRVFASEKVPLDGTIISGTGLIQEAFITGEPVPKEKSRGESVYAGSLVIRGEIDVAISNLVHETVVARIIDAIENVRESKAPIEKVGARFAEQFVPLSFMVAGIAFLMTGDVKRAITMLVIACPCAAGLATPTAVSASIGQAARKGILIKGGTHIETAAKVDAVIFDKTGTITQGQAVVQEFVSVKKENESSAQEVLRLAASAEQFTTHPLGIILRAKAQSQGLDLETVESYENFPGLGITAQLATQHVAVGNIKMLKNLNVALPKRFERELRTRFISGESIIYVVTDGRLRGAFVVHDTIRDEAIDMLSQIKARGVKKILLASGDQLSAVQHVAQALGFDEVHGDLLPRDKCELVHRLKEQGHTVAMVGDGVNDAEALAAADLSIAMGAGRCDVAIEAADVTLARNNLLLIPEVLAISQKTLGTIYQNFTAAVGINAGGLLVTGLGRLSPLAAAFVHNLSTIAVVLNSLWLGKKVAKSPIPDSLKEDSL